jgi:hypothetical protein
VIAQFFQDDQDPDRFDYWFCFPYSAAAVFSSLNSLPCPLYVDSSFSHKFCRVMRRRALKTFELICRHRELFQADWALTHMINYSCVAYHVQQEKYTFIGYPDLAAKGCIFNAGNTDNITHLCSSDEILSAMPRDFSKICDHIEDFASFNYSLHSFYYAWFNSFDDEFDEALMFAPGAAAVYISTLTSQGSFLCRVLYFVFFLCVICILGFFSLLFVGKMLLTFCCLNLSYFVFARNCFSGRVTHCVASTLSDC